MAADPSSPDKPTRPGSSDRMRDFAKYSGLGMQMLATIGLCAWGGVKLDERFQSENPWYTIGLMLFGVVAATYQIIRSLTRNS